MKNVYTRVDASELQKGDRFCWTPGGGEAVVTNKTKHHIFHRWHKVGESKVRAEDDKRNTFNQLGMVYRVTVETEVEDYQKMFKEELGRNIRQVFTDREKVLERMKSRLCANNVNYTLSYDVTDLAEADFAWRLVLGALHAEVANDNDRAVQFTLEWSYEQAKEAYDSIMAIATREINRNHWNVQTTSEMGRVMGCCEARAALAVKEAFSWVSWSYKKAEGEKD